MNVLQTIYNKLKPKTELKTHAVNLSAIDGLQVYLDQMVEGQVKMRDAIDEIGSYSTKLKEGQEQQYDASNSFDYDLNLLKDQLNELGVDAPSKITDLEDEFIQRTEEYWNLVDAFKNIDFNFNTFN